MRYVVSVTGRFLDAGSAKFHAFSVQFYVVVHFGVLQSDTPFVISDDLRHPF